MGENSLSSVEEVISIDDCAAGSSYSTIPFSKKAIHQRDADENLFLRFLELDPMPDSTTASAIGGTTTTITNTIANSGNVATLLAEQRKKAYVRPSNGRTPFTITKKLVRENDNRGYGFSIVWTHPPRVEKVEPGLTADKCGILAGDFVIFVDKHNVVTMPELDILNLIKSQGNTLLLEIYRRSSTKQSNGFKNRNSVTISSNQMMVEQATPKQSAIALEPRPSTACSNTTYSMEATKRRLHLPQVTFSKESIAPHSLDDVPRRFLYQLINSEQHFVTAIQYGMQRFVAPLQERHDLISHSDHRTLFQNLEEILRLSEDILEQLVTEDQDPQLNFASRVYMSKSTAICAAYKRYCNGLKRADCVLVNKSRNSNSEFVTFITIPQVPRKRPDLTSFIHRPLQHFREILKLNLMLASHCRPDTDEFRNFTACVNAFQSAYREITVSEGLMEPLGEGRPLLTLQDLEARLVFTKCKPFTLCVPGRQWVFGGDLSRVEGRSVKPYWTLLFSDIIVFAKVSRDRVLFITEEPLALVNIVDSCFNIRKKTTEFRITVDPNGRLAESPTAHCAPDLSRTPRKNSRRRTIVLRAPSLELKAVWQNLLQRQIFHVNAALGSSLSSPIDSPDIMQTFIPLSDIGAATTSMASIKLSSDSVYLRNQQVRQFRLPSFCASTRSYQLSTSSIPQSQAHSLFGGLNNNHINGNNNSKSLSAIPEIISEIPELTSANSIKFFDDLNKRCSLNTVSHTLPNQFVPNSLFRTEFSRHCEQQPLVDFKLSSVGRSFIDEECEDVMTALNTPETPTPNISPSSSNRFSETFSNDFNKPSSTPSVVVSPIQEKLLIPGVNLCGSWDLLELDLDFHDVNYDPSYGNDLEECIYFGDDPLGVLPNEPTPPDALDL